jgi:amidase
MSMEDKRFVTHRRVEEVSDEKYLSAAPQQDAPGGVSRRAFIQLSSLAGAALTGLGTAPPVNAQEEGPDDTNRAVTDELNEVTIAELQAAMAAGRLTALDLVNIYLRRINALDSRGPKVNSILEINPDARAIARTLDRERRLQGPRGPLHGIPVLLKENIDTADGMLTTAGSLALVGEAPLSDATVAGKLRQAGAVLLGKTNLSEWANFRSFHSSSGWSGRGGQTKNPYVLDRNPCGSSSGSGAAPAANLCAASLGTETDGSIVCPASANCVVGIKPTVGLTSRAGVIPISHTQDTVGVHARTVADAAAVLGALTGVDARDPATMASEGKFFTDYTQFLDPNGLKGARIGIPRQVYFGYSEETDAIAEAVISSMRDAGAIIIDPADIPTAQEITSDSAEIIVLIYEFKRDLNAYLASRTGIPVRTLADVIAFNLAHAEEELKFFLQEIFDLAESDPFSEQEYLDALARSHSLSRERGIDAVMNQYNLDALVAPTGSPPWPTDLINGDHFLGASSSPAAMAGYPLINVPAGFTFGLPVGISFMGRAFSEPTLIKLAYAFEQATHARRPPEFLRTLRLEDNGTDGSRRSSVTVAASKTQSSQTRASADKPSVVRRIRSL